jgi:hypothetical protein
MMSELRTEKFHLNEQFLSLGLGWSIVTDKIVKKLCIKIRFFMVELNDLASDFVICLKKNIFSNK